MLEKDLMDILPRRDNVYDVLSGGAELVVERTLSDQTELPILSGALEGRLPEAEDQAKDVLAELSRRMFAPIKG